MVQLETAEPKDVQDVRQDFPSSLLSGHHHPVRGRVFSQVAEAEVLRVKLELDVFPLCVFFLLPTPGPFPKGRSAEASDSRVPTDI